MTAKWPSSNLVVRTAIRHSRLRGGLKPGEKEYVDHVGYAIEDFSYSRVEAELKRRGLNPKPAGPHAWAIDDVAGFPIQICDTRGVVPEDAYRPYA